MKFSKTSWIFLAVGIVLIAGISLGWIYSQQNDQQQQLATQLSQAKIRLSGIKTDDLQARKEQLTQQIGQYNVQLADAKTRLSSLKDSLDVTNTLLADAKNYGVDVVEISSPGLSGENLSGTNCEILAVALTIKGDISRIAGFVYSLSQIFPTSSIKSVQADVEKTAPAASPSPSEPTTVKTTTATINLVIYNYKGE